MGVMPISHVCQGCGEDLAALRPGPDPHYGLRVVVCPSCRLASVRTREPLIAGWRFARRLVGAALLSAAHLAVVPTLAFGVIWTGGLAETTWQHPDEFKPLRVGTLLIMAAAQSLAAGVWLGVTVTHRPAWQRAAIWGSLLVLLVALGLLAVWATSPWRAPDPREPVLDLAAAGRSAAFIVASVLMVFIADLPAAAGRYIQKFLVQSLFRWRRGRARLRRSGA